MRATDTEIEQINRLRGALSVSDYVRDLVRADATRKLRPAE